MDRLAKIVTLIETLVCAAILGVIIGAALCGAQDLQDVIRMIGG